MTAEQNTNIRTITIDKGTQEKILRWLNEKCGQLRCFCCGMGNFQIAEPATLPVGWETNTGRIHYAIGLPQVSLICSNCGNILNFSLFTMGITPNIPTESLTESPSTI